MNFPTRWTPKYLIEALCSQQVYSPDEATRDEISRLLEILHAHRPVDNSGKHGMLHTPTCGCDDVGTLNDSKEPTVGYGDGVRMTDAEFEAHIRAGKK